MEVEFKNGYKIVTDSLQFIVQKRKVIQAGAKTKKENIGNVVYENVAYCSTLDFALRTIGHKLVLEINDIQEIKKALNSLEREITAMTELLEIEVKFNDEEN